MNSGANDQAKVLPFAAFHYHGQVVVYRCWPHARIKNAFKRSIILLFQQLMNLSIKGWRRRGDMMAKHPAWVKKRLPCYTDIGDQLKDDQHPYNKL